ncbi:hypothetical protein C7439_14310 [Lachnoanaerobaculum umeaense]|nr:hypothetical protein C7439_14310 [Lachnoanaerobaculum umeaense]
MFPFLIGKVLTKKNKELYSDASKWVTKFPFLIGKVLTIRFIIRYIKIILFPFLIGKVLTVTIGVTILSSIPMAFPFLIGKVLTVSKRESSDPKTTVSIPYR